MEIPASEYLKYTTFTARLNALFTSGTIESRVAVVYPMTSIWAHFTPSHRSMYEHHPDPDVRFLDTSFCDLCRSLLQQQIGYDIIDERSLAGATIDGNSLVVGEREYQALVLPPMDTIRLQTMEVIARFVGAGGALFGHALTPKYAADGPRDDMRVEAMVGEIRASGGIGGSLPGSPPIGYLLKSRIPPDRALEPASPAILCTTVRRDEGPAHFFVNTSSVEYTGRCTLRAEGKLVLYEPSNGEERSLSWEKTGDAAKRISLKLRPFEALFVLVR
jgi:hypothetical protein